MRLDAQTEKVLRTHDWPGNVRELENVLERAVNLSEDGMIDPQTLGFWPEAPKRVPARSSSLGYLEEVEKQAIADVIRETGYNLSTASRKLGISRATLYNKIKKYRLALNRAGEAAQNPSFQTDHGMSV
jgi:DNA-binding NtrC family response regulator